MNQIAIGTFIAKKRKEKNLTQEQLAEKLSVSNKTVSKWETGKCMPDYSVIEQLCRELGITLAELMNAEEDEKSIHTYDNEHVIKMLEEMQVLMSTKKLLIGCVLIAMGIALLALSFAFGGTEIQDFISGLMLGISIPEMLAGVILAVRGACELSEKTKSGR